MKSKYWQLTSESEQEELGQTLAKNCSAGLVIYLEGELGAGKTTLARGFVRGLGYEGKVKSPTYTLVEEYPVGDRSCFHFDLYRLADPEELEFMGMRDFLLDKDILLIEWPEKGAGFLPGADIFAHIQYLKNGRQVEFSARTEKGNLFLEQLPLKDT